MAGWWVTTPDPEGHLGHLGLVLESAWVGSRSGREVATGPLSLDLVLELQGRREAVHSIVLATHSRHIADTLAIDPAPRIFNLDSLSISPRSLRAALHYAYFGTIQLSTDNLHDTLTAAIALRMPGLAHTIERWILAVAGHPASLPFIVYTAFSLPVATVTRAFVFRQALLRYDALITKPAFIHLPLSFIAPFLDSDHLPLAHESEIFQLALSWLQANDEALNHFSISLLIDQIRFSAMSPRQLQDASNAALETKSSRIVAEVNMRISAVTMLRTWAAKTGPRPDTLALLNQKPPRPTAWATAWHQGLTKDDRPKPVRPNWLTHGAAADVDDPEPPTSTTPSHTTPSRRHDNSGRSCTAALTDFYL